MRVVVNPDLCEAHGLCMGVVPEVFDLGDGDMVTVLEEHPAEHLRALVEQAVVLCPKQAISVHDD